MENSIRLKRVLISNAVFSMGAGVIMLLMSNTMANLFNLDSALVFYILGPGLILFGADVFYTAQKKLDKRKQILTISFMDFGWVLGSLLIILTGAFNLSWIGYDLIGLVALVVLLFGVLQLKFNR